MIDEMTNPSLIDYVVSSDDSTEIERELADRLRYAIEEIDRLVHTVRQLEIQNGSNTGSDSQTQDQSLAD